MISLKVLADAERLTKPKGPFWNIWRRYLKPEKTIEKSYISYDGKFIQLPALKKIHQNRMIQKNWGPLIRGGSPIFKNPINN